MVPVCPAIFSTGRLLDMLLLDVPILAEMIDIL